MFITERRSARRFKVSLDASWEGTLAQCGGLVVDLSEAGCFILTSDRVLPREMVRVELRPSPGERVQVWGEVIYQVPEMGFGLRFVRSDDAAHETVGHLVARLHADEPAGARA
ncbi:MAG: PilZ domain-containing protein [Pyrinomonadaceae bacterium]